MSASPVSARCFPGIDDAACQWLLDVSSNKHSQKSGIQTVRTHVSHLKLVQAFGLQHNIKDGEK